MATPTLVQHVLYHSNENFETGNGFKLEVPNATLTNNCLVLFLTYAYDAARTVSITDNIGNSWSGTPYKKADDTSNGLTSAAFILTGATAGVNLITVTFDNPLLGFQASFSEWYNVATSSATDGGNGAPVVLTLPVTSGSFSTTTNGDLILQYVIDSNYGPQLNGGRSDGVTTVAKNSGYTLLHGDEMYACAVQYQVQSSFGPTNPGINFGGITAGNQSFNSVTISLKSAAAGTAPGSTVRILGIKHSRFIYTATGSYPLWMPTQGNAAAFITAYPQNVNTVNSISGASSGSWTVYAPSALPQAAYKTPLTASDTEVLTINLTYTGNSNIQYILYDIVNCGSFDTQNSNLGSAFGPGNSGTVVSITPGAATGLALCAIGVGTGPIDSVISPSGAQIDSGFFTGYTDLDPLDSGDFYGHYYFGSNATQNWQIHDTQATGSVYGVVITFGNIVAAAADNTSSRSVQKPSLRLGTPVSSLRSGRLDTGTTPPPFIEQPAGPRPRRLRLGTPLSRLRSGNNDTGAGSTSLTLNLVGITATFSAGTVTPNIAPTLSGSTSTTSAGTLTAGNSPSLTGSSSTSSAGTFVEAADIPLVGATATFTAGTITYSAGGNVTVNLTGASITSSAGTLGVLFGLPMLGSTSTSTFGTLTPSTALALSAATGTTSTGTLTPGLSAALSGLSSTSSAGAFGEQTTVGLSGSTIHISQGIIISSGGTPTGGNKIFQIGLGLSLMRLGGRVF